jgi:hypothetical protein
MQSPVGSCSVFCPVQRMTMQYTSQAVHVDTGPDSTAFTNIVECHHREIKIKAPALKRHCSKVTRRGDCTPNSSDHDTNHTTQNIHIQTEHQHAWIRQGNRQQHNCPSCAANARHPTQVPCCLSGCDQETSQPAGHCGFIPACLLGPDSKTAVQVWLHPKGKDVVSPINRIPLRSYYINRTPRVMTCAGPCDRHCCDCRNSRPSCQCCCCCCGLDDKIHEDPISDARYVTEDPISGCSW